MTRMFFSNHSLMNEKTKKLKIKNTYLKVSHFTGVLIMEYSLTINIGCIHQGLTATGALGMEMKKN